MYKQYAYAQQMLSRWNICARWKVVFQCFVESPHQTCIIFRPFLSFVQPVNCKSSIVPLGPTWSWGFNFAKKRVQEIIYTVRESEISPVVIVEGQLNCPPPLLWRPIEFPPSLTVGTVKSPPPVIIEGQLNFSPPLFWRPIEFPPSLIV
jgi:hypothetical protein